VKPGRYFFYFDPIHLLPEEGSARWEDPAQHQMMIEQALARARAER
jgi:lysine 2,3-aminomutase